MWEKKILIDLDENKCWMHDECFQVSKDKDSIMSISSRIIWGRSASMISGNRVTIARREDKIKKIKISE